MKDESVKKSNRGCSPKLTINYEILNKLCNIHCIGEECASILEIDYDTLNNRLKEDGHGGFSDYFKKHSAKGKMSLRRKQIESALDGNTTMLIWLGKQYLDQKDQAVVDNRSSDGSMSPSGFNDFYADESDEESDEES